MTPSIYNVTAPALDGSSTVLYNTLSGACVLLDERDVRRYEHLQARPEQEWDVDDLELAKELATLGLTVDRQQDEVDYMRYKFQQYKYDDRVLELYIAPTLDCNFSCVYCYEHKRKGKMTREVADAVARFVDEQYEAQPFKELKIVWYGGEPLLCMDIIEYLSRAFIDFVDERGLEYRASVITNGSLADDEVQRRLLQLRVWCMMITADGLSGVHEQTRRALDGNPSFDTIMHNVDGCLDKGLSVDFRCVLGDHNAASCIELARRFADNDKINVHFNQMRDLTDFSSHNSCGICALDPQGHADAVLEEFLNRRPSKDDFERELRPLPVSCPTSIERSYTIDELGNVYACTSTPGMDEYILFNILEAPEQRAVNMKLVAMYGNETPLDHPECSVCRVFPLCQGGCTRCRMEGKMECTPFKYNIEDFLTEYSRYL